MSPSRFNPFASVEGSKIFAILCLLVVTCAFTASNSDRFMRPDNIENVVHRTSLFGILSIGVAFVIITGGIDLSIGSVVCLAGVLLPMFVRTFEWSFLVAVLTVIAISASIGLIHGLMITKMRLQPFVVTLCGLLIYRGIARGITQDVTQGFGSDKRFKGLRAFATEKFSLIDSESFGLEVRATGIILVIVAIIAIVLLNRTVFGRYLMAIGSNVEAARYSGINTDRITTLAYVICSTLAGIGGMLFVLELNQAQPSSSGNFYELYAIAAAVLGGCSLRGGEGNIIGVVIGAALLQVLYNTINLVYPQYQNIEFAIIGGVILAGVTADAVIRRFIAVRQTRIRE
jgi:ribose transport system permease protein